MSVHSICSVQYQSAVYHRISNFCLKFVGVSCNPFFFSCAHHVQGLVRSFLGKLDLARSPATTGLSVTPFVILKCRALNCFK
jgi:hypothetical protein